MAQPCQYSHGARADVDRMLARSEPMDLARNVFHNGVWGTLRQTPLSVFLDASVQHPPHIE